MRACSAGNSSSHRGANSVTTKNQSATCPGLIPHHLVVGEHLPDGGKRRVGKQGVEFAGCAREEFPAVLDHRRTGCAVRTFRRASGEQARRDREDGG